MSSVQVEQVHLTFDASVDPFQYERAGQNVQGWPPGAKVVDVVCNAPGTAPTVTWLIEVKDFRVITNPPRPANLVNLADTVDAKIRQTLTSLPVVSANSADADAKAHAAAALSSGRKRVVLHLEPHANPGTHSHLFPAGFQALVLQKLRQLVQSIDPTPLVLDIARTPAAGVPWSAS